MEKIVKRRITAVVFAATILVGVAAPAMGNPSPPTNGGNGAGKSGQCTGNPDDRPAVCPGT
jgi:hypothetical protein